MYNIKNSRLGKTMSAVLTAAVVMSASAFSVFADTRTSAGTYTVDATLSCYVNAMGGVEFSDGYGLLKSAEVTIEDDGSAKATLHLGTTSGLSVYGVDCTAFIGTDEAPGYYKDGTVTKEGVTYTESTDTAANSKGDVHYVTSITMPVDTKVDEYTMWVYLDSNVMGCQLGDGTGTGASNTPGVATKHTSKLTIDWDSLKVGSGDTSSKADTTTNQSATVEYTVEFGYEVEIPSTITIDAVTKTGSYTVTAKNFSMPADGYVTVEASESGKLVNGSDELTFSNELTGGKLTKSGDALNGKVTVTQSAVNPGKYTGTIDFVISYYSGK